jgi:methyl-accepting chemotaxis protein
MSEIARAVGDVAEGAERQVRMVDEARKVSDETAEAAATTRDVSADGLAAAVRAAEAIVAVRDSAGNRADQTWP